MALTTAVRHFQAFMVSSRHMCKFRYNDQQAVVRALKLFRLSTSKTIRTSGACAPLLESF